VRLLVVDDDAVFRDELAELLRDDGHSAVAVPSVAKALQALEHEEADVVLTDLKMPRQGGLELLREVRQRWPRTLVVVVTGFASVDTALDAMKHGAFDYVRKPFRLEQIRETLRLAAAEHEFEAPPEARRDPVREALALAESGRHDVLFFGEPAPRPGPHITVRPLEASEPFRLVGETEAFALEHPNAAVVLAGAEQLLAGHRLEEIVGILDRLRDTLAGHGPLRVGFDARRLLPAAAAAVGGAVAGDATHVTLDAVANPIRRRVLQRLADGPASFGDAMAAAGLDDSPKMSFHLRRLVEAGLVRHEAEHYRLSGRGEAAVRLLSDAAFLPPADDSANLAFADRSRGRPDDRP